MTLKQTFGLLLLIGCPFLIRAAWREHRSPHHRGRWRYEPITIVITMPGLIPAIALVLLGAEQSGGLMETLLFLFGCASLVLMLIALVVNLLLYAGAVKESSLLFPEYRKSVWLNPPPKRHHQRTTRGRDRKRKRTR